MPFSEPTITTISNYMVNPVPPFNWPSISGDNYPPDEFDMEGNPIFGANIPSVYDGQPCEFDIELWVEHRYTQTTGEGEEAVTNEFVAFPDILEVGYIDKPPVDSITVNIMNTDIINVAPTISGAFPEEKFIFIFDDLSTKELPRVNNEDWMAVKEWRQPPIDEKKIFYELFITYDEISIESTIVPGGTINFTLDQFVYWSWQISLQSFQAQVEESKVRLLERAPRRVV